MLGRLQVELYGPLIRRSYNLLAEQKYFPDAPEQLQAALEIYYTSPAAKAQQASKSVGARRWIEEIGLLTQISPDAAVSTRATRTPEQIQEIRRARADTEARQMAAQQAPLEAQAVKNLAEASSISATTPPLG